MYKERGNLYSDSLFHEGNPFTQRLSNKDISTQTAFILKKALLQRALTRRTSHGIRVISNIILLGFTHMPNRLGLLFLGLRMFTKFSQFGQRLHNEMWHALDHLGISGSKTQAILNTSKKPCKNPKISKKTKALVSKTM